MNAHTIQLFDKLMEQSMARFSELPVVKTAVYTDNTCHLADKVKYVTQLYVECFKNFGWLPKEIPFYNRIVYGDTKSLSEVIPKDPVLSQVFDYLPKDKSIPLESPAAFHRHFVILPDFYSVSGILWVNSAQQLFMCLSECSVVRDTVIISPGRYAYLSELLEQYDPLLNPSLREWIKEKEISFNKLQRDSKSYWGDTFYSYYMKTKVIEAIGEILFTSKTLKEIALHQKFGKYSTLYKTFKRYGIDLTKVSRFSKV
ncbi:hypothetical protein H3Z85_17955 [Chryseobacterium indologenes]|uniref:hypothetical protein n=1 Tax=Chryseobacterium indologenes TaxID=253 RepID=UPI0003E07C3B|nr:hypothetical protein [Chryseobacterium indologenes]QPQ51194.1 hypothetical protein H3Z85_17955 [Chryseobacterium indologenes]GAE66768.1 hypothetical protein CIN01S_18_00950 [Chryseobacterium indologenes NBRC 14944]SFK01159.1 hypothetical protein SAMN05421692_3120 [Chryseobacterium indologenes]SUX49580.1 Uncharacterised protein [Chryseobacterium indologenes]